MYSHLAMACTCVTMDAVCVKYIIVTYKMCYTHVCYCYGWNLTISMCAQCLSRVCRSQMAIVLWHRSNNVGKQEMDALLDIAVSSSDTEKSSSKSPARSASKGSRKRPREEDSKPEEQGTLALFYTRMLHSLWSIKLMMCDIIVISIIAI